MLAAAMLATSCSNDDETINPSNSGDGVLTVSTPETTSIPFAIKVDMSQSLSKMGGIDNGTQVNITFTDEDVTNKLAMTIRSNTKKDEDGDPISYCTLTLTDVNGVFTGQIDSWKDKPTDGEELLAEIDYAPGNTSQWSTVSLVDLIKHSDCKYRGTFTFYENDFPNYEFKDENIPTVRLTSQNAYFEFNFPNANNSISYGYSRLSSEGEEEDPYTTYTQNISSDHKLWLAMDMDLVNNYYISTYGYYGFVIQYNWEIIYRKPLSKIKNGVIYSVTRN